MAEKDCAPDLQLINEVRREARVITGGVLGMSGDEELSQIAERAATATNFPFSAVSIVDHKRLWLAVAYGFDPREFARPNSFCDAAIQVPGYAPLCVADAWEESRFRFAPAVIEMNVRAYYAAPLVTGEGFALGTLCLLDTVPRTIDANGLDQLKSCARHAIQVIDRETNARAYAQRAINELCARIRLAIEDNDHARVKLLDEELRLLDAKLQSDWN